MQFKIPFTLLFYIISAESIPTVFNYTNIAQNVNKYFNSTDVQMATTAFGVVTTGMAAGVTANYISKHRSGGPWGPLKYRKEPPQGYIEFVYEPQLEHTKEYLIALDRLHSSDVERRDTRTTIISLFYPDPGAEVRRPLEVYLERMERLIHTGRPIIMYTTPDVASEIRSRPNARTDPYLILIEDYPTVDDIPNIRDHVSNFSTVYKDRFPDETRIKRMWTRNYNRAHNMKTYNAKAWIIRDGIQRNPFQSEIFLFSDAGLFSYPDEPRQEAWGDTEKLEATLASIPRDSIAISQVVRLKDGNHKCWKDPEWILECHSFAANGFFGYKEGMIRFAEAMFVEFDRMNYSGWYVGREEFIISRMAVSNQGLLRSYEAWNNPINSNLKYYNVRWAAFGKALEKDEPMTLVDPFVNPSPRTWFSEKMFSV